MLPIYYINLSTRPDRQAYMEAQLASLGLAGERIEAVTPVDIAAADIALYCNSDRPSFLRPSELACTLSHERAWGAMLDAGHEQALVLEDDAEPSSLLPSFLAEAPGIEADLIRIETTGAPTRVYPPISTGPSGVAVRRFRSTPMGSAGYILRAQAASKLLGHPALRLRHTDLALYNPFEEPGASLNRVLTDPGLCRPLNMAEQQAGELARSDIARTMQVHAFAERHPLRFAILSWQKKLLSGFRNAADHFAQRDKGLERRVIPFGFPAP